MENIRYANVRLEREAHSALRSRAQMLQITMSDTVAFLLKSNPVTENQLPPIYPALAVALQQHLNELDKARQCIPKTAQTEPPSTNPLL